MNAGDRPRRAQHCTHTLPGRAPAGITQISKGISLKGNRTRRMSGGRYGAGACGRDVVTAATKPRQTVSAASCEGPASGSSSIGLATASQSVAQESHSRWPLSRAGALSLGELQQPLSQPARSAVGCSFGASAQQRTKTPARQSIGAPTSDHTTVMIRTSLPIGFIIRFDTLQFKLGLPASCNPHRSEDSGAF